MLIKHACLPSSLWLTIFGKGCTPWTRFVKAKKKLVGTPNQQKSTRFSSHNGSVFLALSIDILQGISVAVLMFSRRKKQAQQVVRPENWAGIVRGSRSISDRDTRKISRALSFIHLRLYCTAPTVAVNGRQGGRTFLDSATVELVEQKLFP